MALRSKLRWREAAIRNVKDHYVKCKRLIAVRNAKLTNLKRCLHLSHLKCDALLIESRDREYKLANLMMRNKDFEAALLWSCLQLDIVQCSIVTTFWTSKCYRTITRRKALTPNAPDKAKLQTDPSMSPNSFCNKDNALNEPPCPYHPHPHIIICTSFISSIDYSVFIVPYYNVTKKTKK